MNDLITLADLNTAINHEPRVLDVLVAERLGFKRRRKVRELIKANLPELESYGPVAQHRIEASPQSGAGVEYWLNEAQALLICTFSRTPKAAAVRKALIEVYQAYRSGTLAPKPLPSPDTVQVRSYTRRKAVSPAVKRYTEILEVALARFASMSSVCNKSLKELDRMKYFKDAMMGVLKLAADMEMAGAPREEVLRAAGEGGSFVGYDCGGGRYRSGDVLDFPKHWAEVCPVTKDLIAKGLMAPRT